MNNRQWFGADGSGQFHDGQLGPGLLGDLRRAERNHASGTIGLKLSRYVGRASLAIAAGLTLGAGLIATSQPAQADVVEQGPESFVSRNVAIVSAKPRDVWLALIEPAKWWNDQHSWSGDAANLTITPKAGGCFCERLPAKESFDMPGLEGSAQHMTILQANPDVALRMRGGLGPLQSEPVDGVLTIALKPVEQGTMITFEYVVGGPMRFQTSEISRAVDSVMLQQLTGLANVLGLVDMPKPVSKAAAKSGSAPASAPKPAAKPTDSKLAEDKAKAKTPIAETVKSGGAADASAGKAAEKSDANSSQANAIEDSRRATVDDVFGDLKDDDN